MSVQSVGNALSAQQVQQLLQQLQQQSLAGADPNIANDSGISAAATSGQNLLIGTNGPATSTTGGPSTLSGQTSLAPATVQALLQAQEQVENNDLWFSGASSGVNDATDPVVAALDATVSPSTDPVLAALDGSSASSNNPLLTPINTLA